MEEVVSKGRGTDVGYEMREESVHADTRSVWDNEAEYEDCEVMFDLIPDDDEDDSVVSVSSVGCPALLDAEIDDDDAKIEGLKVALEKLLSELSASGLFAMGVE